MVSWPGPTSGRSGSLTNMQWFSPLFSEIRVSTYDDEHTKAVVVVSVTVVGLTARPRPPFRFRPSYRLLPTTTDSEETNDAVG